MTDTPEKQELIEQNKKKAKRTAKEIIPVKKTARAKKRLVLEIDDSDEEMQIELDDTDDDIDFYDSNEEQDIVFAMLTKDPNKDDFVVVKVKTLQKQIPFRHFVAIISSTNSEEKMTEVSYMKKSRKSEKHFFMLNNPEKSDIKFSDIVCKLPKPQPIGATKRCNNIVAFPISLCHYNVQ